MSTKNKAIHALHHSYSASDSIVVDANVLVSVFSGLEPPNSIPLRNYSEAIKRIRRGGARILLDVLVLSEFVNTCARRYYNLALSQGGVWSTFKDYRNSPDFPPVAAAIAHAGHQILSLANRIDHAFISAPIGPVLVQYSLGKDDVNDLMLVEI